MSFKYKIITAPDGKEMVWIPKGKCNIGSENGYSDEKPVHEFSTEGFYMDIKPVTNREYCAFCDAVGRGYPAIPPWDDTTDYFEKYADHPVVNVSLEMCKEYAAWAGKIIPKEEEWEYAARGGLKNAEFPWGNALPDVGGCKANFADSNSTQSWRNGLANDGYQYTSPVGSYAPNKFGLYDIVGNTYEYVDDWYFSYSDKVRSTAGFNDGWGGSRVCRGGCYHSPMSDMRVARRHEILGGGANEMVGFRCISYNGEFSESACKKIDKTSQRNAPSHQNDWFNDILKNPIVTNDGIGMCAGIGNPVSEDELKKIKHCGFTSVEQYVTWRTCEGKGKDKWDFSYWDKEVKKIKDAGLSWLPFIIAGPGYSLPDWFLKSDQHHGLFCAEHGIESKVQSFWDKNFYKHIDRFLKALSEHYTDTSIFEGLLFGISGDFGEAIVSVWHGNWPTHTCGTYHAHSGYWCADPFAVKDFKDKMKSKYKGDINALNNAWGEKYADFNHIKFPKLTVSPDSNKVDAFTNEGTMPVEKPGDRLHILDFVDWYRKSMTNYVSFWMKTAKKYFPDTKLYLCTGGEAQPCHASEFAWQSKVCAPYGGVRITNEDSNFEKNFCITNWVASACDFYGGEFSFEPAGSITERGVVCRIYNATATGSDSLHFYAGNVIERNRLPIYRDNNKHYIPGRVTREWGAFYPDTSIMFNPNSRADAVTTFSALRDFGDFGYADDLTVKDGILSTYKALVLTVGGYYRKETLKRIEKFVKKGGLLVNIGFDELRCIEDSSDWNVLLFSNEGIKNIGKGKTLKISESLCDKMEDSDITKTIFSPLKNFFVQNGVYVSDGVRDRFYTAQKGEKLVCMNYGFETLNREITLPNGDTTEISIAPATIKYI